MEYTSNILMIRPVNFTFNEQTAVSNAFQNKSDDQTVQQNALQEFDQLVNLLKKNGINVVVIDDTPFPHTPDSIFPNNWISFHEDGSVFLYPMQAENRRQERKPAIIETLKQKCAIREIYDLTYFENRNEFLEGTGSMVLDRKNKIAYACISPRTDLNVLNKFCRITGYKEIHFHSEDANKIPVYHTNVMMCLASLFVVICLDSITNEEEKKMLKESLRASKREIIEINQHQLNAFAGNMIQLVNKYGDKLIVMSDSAFNSLTNIQVERLEKYGKLLHTSLSTIERNGGGSARCMIAEIYLPCHSPSTTE